MANDLINQKPMGTSLVVQWIRLHAQGTINKIPHIPTKPTLQLLNPHALEACTTEKPTCSNEDPVQPKQIINAF